MFEDSQGTTGGPCSFPVCRCSTAGATVAEDSPGTSGLDAGEYGGRPAQKTLFALDNPSVQNITACQQRNFFEK